LKQSIQSEFAQTNGGAGKIQAWLHRGGRSPNEQALKIRLRKFAGRMTEVLSLPPISSTFGCTDFEFLVPRGYIASNVLLRPSSQEHDDQVV
jgi:hypothetical protein